MGHARAADLLDVADVLDAIRALPGVSERSSGIFYVGRGPFLHFHTKDGERWADAKTGRDWGPEMPLPLGATARAKAAFLREVRARHAACAGGMRARADRGRRASAPR
jgi:hypothetical protein